MGFFIANFIRFLAMQNFDNRSRFDKITESLKVGRFLRQCITGQLQCPAL